jgi:hypothetical protein
MNYDFMQAKQPIDFHRKRDFGELFNSTFNFIREEFKPLMKALFTVIMPLVLVIILIIFLMFGSISGDFFSPGIDNPFANNSFEFVIYFFIVYLLFGLTALVQFTLVYAYIKLYIANGASPSIGATFEETKRHVLRVIAITFLNMVYVMAGFVALFFPGIWVSNIVQLAYPAAILDGYKIADSHGRAFKIISGYWWFTFGATFVCSLIVNIITSIPSFAMQVIMQIFIATGGEYSEGFSTGIMIMFAIFAVVIFLFMMIASLIPEVFLAFHYFNLKERKEETGLMGSIDSIKNEEATQE